MRPASEPYRTDLIAEATGEELPLIDQHAMRGWCDDLEREDVLAVLARVPDEGARCLAELQKAIAGGDLTSARRTAHRLKGMASNLGAARLARTARSIELTSQSIEDVSAHMPVLEKTLQATLESLGSYY